VAKEVAEMSEEKKPRKRGKRDANYYASRAMSKAERMELNRAAERSGLSDEIALLRVRLKAAMEAPPEDKQARRDVRVLTEAMWVLLRAVAVEYRISPKATKDLAESLAGTLQILGDFILPPDR
jgi:hypothetical protein